MTLTELRNRWDFSSTEISDDDLRDIYLEWQGEALDFDDEEIEQLANEQMELI